MEATIQPCQTAITPGWTVTLLMLGERLGYSSSKAHNNSPLLGVGAYFGAALEVDSEGGTAHLPLFLLPTKFLQETLL